MKRILAPLTAAAALALFAAPASAQDDPIQKLVEKFQKQFEQIEKKVGDLGKQLEKALENQKDEPFDFSNLMERFNDLWNDLELEKYFGDFQMPDMNEMFERLREQFGDQFGDGFDLEDLMEQFRDQFGGVDLEQMMEELRRMFEEHQMPEEDDDGEDFYMVLPICLN